MLPLIIYFPHGNIKTIFEEHFKTHLLPAKRFPVKINWNEKKYLYWPTGSIISKSCLTFLLLLYLEYTVIFHVPQKIQNLFCLSLPLTPKPTRYCLLLTHYILVAPFSHDSTKIITYFIFVLFFRIIVFKWSFTTLLFISCNQFV